MPLSITQKLAAFSFEYSRERERLLSAAEDGQGDLAEQQLRAVQGHAYALKAGVYLLLSECDVFADRHSGAVNMEWHGDTISPYTTIRDLSDTTSPRLAYSMKLFWPGAQAASSVAEWECRVGSKKIELSIMSEDIIAWKMSPEMPPLWTEYRAAS